MGVPLREGLVTSDDPRVVGVSMQLVGNLGDNKFLDVGPLRGLLQNVIVRSLFGFGILRSF